MFHILGIVFIVLIAILVIGLALIGTVIRSLFGLGRHRSRSYQNGSAQQSGGYSFDNNRESDSYSNEQANASEEEDAQNKRKKLFAQDEGEYVEFEEIKE